ALAESGDLWVAYGGGGVPIDFVYGYGEKDEPLASFPVRKFFNIEAMAIDATGLLAVVEREPLGGQNARAGSLYEPLAGRLMTEFVTAPNVPSNGIVVSGEDELYAAVSARHEILGYKHVLVAELLIAAAMCNPGVVVESSMTFDCVLNGTVNPEGVTETMVWFQWGAG